MFTRNTPPHHHSRHQQAFRAGRIGLLATIFTGMQFFPLASKVLSQTLIPGLVIENQATGSYVDPTDSTSYNLESNIVQVTVAEIAGITVTPTGVVEAPSTIGDPGPNQGDSSINADDVVYFLFQITNVGNDPTQFFIPGQALSITGGTQAGSIELIRIDPDGPDGETEATDFSSLPITVHPEGSNTGDATAFGMPVGALQQDGTVTLRVPVKLSSGLLSGDTATVILGDTAGNDNADSTQNQPYEASLQSDPPAGGFDLYTQDNKDTDGLEGEGTGDPLNGDATLHRQEASGFNTVTIGSSVSNIDYGDAPDEGVGTGRGDYQTTASDSGAAHTIDPNLSIGIIPDGDDGTVQSLDADLDDTSGIAADEGSINLPKIFQISDSYTISDIEVTNNTSLPATLFAWIDFDNSGTFDANEVQTVTVPNTGLQNVNLTWSGLSGLVGEETYVRFRLTTDSLTHSAGAIDPDERSIGLASDGEVEDYRVEIQLDLSDKSCPGTKADLWFANDESGSVQEDEFDDALDYLYQISDRFLFDEVDGMQAGIIGWGDLVTAAEVVMPITAAFGDPDDTGLLQNANISVDGDGQGLRELYDEKKNTSNGTNLAFATNYLTGLINGGNGRRTGVDQIAIVLTDASGGQLDSDTTGGSAWLTATDNLRNAGPDGTSVVIILVNEAATAYNTNNPPGVTAKVDAVVGSDTLFVATTYSDVADATQDFIDDTVQTICDVAGPTVNAPNVLLVKRITAINDQDINPHDGTNLSALEDLDTDLNDDAFPSNNWPSDYLIGAINGGVIKPGDEIEYTIYFLSAGEEPANNVVFCDRIPDGQTFSPDSFSSIPPAPDGDVGNERGIEVSTNSVSLSYTNIGGDDTGRFYPPTSGLPTACNVLIPNTENNGAVVVNLGDLPLSTGAGAPGNSFGLVRFRTTIDN